MMVRHATDPYHVQIEKGNTKAQVILVEDPLKLAIEESVAFVKPWPTPWIKGSALELFASDCQRASTCP